MEHLRPGRAMAVQTAQGILNKGMHGSFTSGKQHSNPAALAWWAGVWAFGNVLEGEGGRVWARFGQQ